LLQESCGKILWFDRVSFISIEALFRGA